ncbi:uncharacterized protein At1g76070-like [Dioscorea cayenensis subsp. rotundata]|uniref:Uncharacterized protein At1g76070-like n=1 Tax=Dioscorea cayennensis subsp. rotundata TaxID=55577 RepID=A0AB40CK10_DIOCR|nr:uncharacterized protein At1g76070-like [Dioscorea cayenensis subsp. rotundata]
MEKQASKTKKNLIFKLFSKHPSFLVLGKSPHTSFNRNKASFNKKMNNNKNNKNNKKPKITATNKEASDKHSQNPTSPKISCFGGLLTPKNKKKKKKKMTTMTKKPSTKPLVYSRVRTVERLYSGVGNGRNTHVLSRIPNSLEVRRLASRHETFKKFDRRLYYENLEKDDDDGKQEEEVVIDVSSINLDGGDVSLEPRKEVNLWNRRSKLPPPPLQLN